jgi:hypothetical protein
MGGIDKQISPELITVAKKGVLKDRKDENSVKISLPVVKTNFSQ